MTLATKTEPRTEERDVYVSVEGSDVGKDLGSKENPHGGVQLALYIIGAKKGAEAELTYRIMMGPGVPPGPYQTPGGRRVVFVGWDGEQD